MRKLLIYSYWWLAGILLLSALPTQAQSSSAQLVGTVLSDEDDALLGATVAAIHLPTGSRRNVTSDFSGAFTIPNMLAGGPYAIQVTMAGYGTQLLTNVFLADGQPLNLALVLPAGRRAPAPSQAHRPQSVDAVSAGSVSAVGNN